MGVVSGRVLESAMVVEVGRCVKLRCHCSAGKRDKREGRGLFTAVPLGMMTDRRSGSESLLQFEAPQMTI